MTFIGLEYQKKLSIAITERWMITAALVCFSICGLFFHYSKLVRAKCLRIVSNGMRTALGRKKAREMVLVRGNYSCPLPSGRDSILQSIN